MHSYQSGLGHGIYYLFSQKVIKEDKERERERQRKRERERERGRQNPIQRICHYIQADAWRFKEIYSCLSLTRMLNAIGGQHNLSSSVGEGYRRSYSQWMTVCVCKLMIWCLQIALHHYPSLFNRNREYVLVSHVTVICKFQSRNIRV